MRETKRKKQDQIVKRCPNCNGEYMDWVEKCPDCGNANLIRCLVCPGCYEARLPIKEPMDLPCPVCAYVPSVGHQDPSALKDLIEAKLKSIDDEDASSGPLVRIFDMGASPHKLTSAPRFRILVPARYRFLIQIRAYGIALLAVLLPGFLVMIATGGKKLGVISMIVLMVVFFRIRNHLLMSGFSEVFDAYHKLLLEDKPNNSLQ